MRMSGVSLTDENWSMPVFRCRVVKLEKNSCTSGIRRVILVLQMDGHRSQSALLAVAIWWSLLNRFSDPMMPLTS